MPKLHVYIDSGGRLESTPIADWKIGLYMNSSTPEQARNLIYLISREKRPAWKWPGYDDNKPSKSTTDNVPLEVKVKREDAAAESINPVESSDYNP